VVEALSHQQAEPVQVQVPASTRLGGDTTTCFPLGVEQTGSSDSKVVQLTDAGQRGWVSRLPGRAGGRAGR
jgi:hypothetical protein